MLFSIIIPVYNVEKYLTSCIESILSQVDENSDDIEILLIDDGSTDKSGQICDSYYEKYPNLFHVFHNENRGLFLSRRYGFEKSNGCYIINCDSDDTLEPDAIEILRTVVIGKHPDLILYNMNSWDGETKKIYFEDVFTQDKMCFVEKKALYHNYFNSHESISMCTKVFKKECLNFKLDYSDFKNKNFGEDTLQSAEIFTQAQSILYLNKALYNYRTTSGMTKKFNEHYYQDFCFINSYIKQYKPMWKIDNFDELYATKLFTIVGRSITQSRYSKMKYSNRKEYLKKIVNDEDYQQYKYLFNRVKKHIKFNYQIFDTLLMLRQYMLIHILLKLKNVNGNLKIDNGSLLSV